MDDITCEVHGLSELQQALEELPFNVAKKGLRAALSDGAAPIQEAMVTLAPKDTGFLAEHFNVKFKMRSDSLAGSAFIGPQGKIDYPAYVSGAYRIIRNKAGKVVKKAGKIAVATVARFLEFGTQKMAKKPFMTQAYETQKDAALARITERLAAAVASAAEEAPKGPKA